MFFKFFLLPIGGSFVLAFFGLVSLYKFAARAAILIAIIEAVMACATIYVVSQGGYSVLWVYVIIPIGFILMVCATWIALLSSIAPQEVVPAKVVHDNYIELSDDQKKAVHTGLKFAAKVGSALLADHLKKSGYTGASTTLIRASKKL